MSEITNEPASEPDREPLLFDAVLTPYRSLSPRGFAILMGTAGVIGFAFGACFIALGAWPIFGFCGAEWLLFYLFFRLNYRAARLQERIRMTPDIVTIERRDPRGRVQSWSFQPYWLRIEMDEPPQHESQLSLTSHGKRLTIGRFLSPPERHELAKALRTALAGAKRGITNPAAG
jgi:uncharacterized membrane protein